MIRYGESYTTDWQQKGSRGSHYSLAFAEDLLDFGLQGAEVLEEITNGHPDRACLFYRGMSGIALATAITMAQLAAGSKKSHQVYIRKSNEESHGGPVELSSWARNPEYFVFVDDFVCSGTTFRAALAGLREAISRCNHNPSRIKMEMPKRVYLITQSSGGGRDLLEEGVVKAHDWYSLY